MIALLCHPLDLAHEMSVIPMPAGKIISTGMIGKRIALDLDVSGHGTIYIRYNHGMNRLYSLILKRGSCGDRHETCMNISTQRNCKALFPNRRGFAKSFQGRFVIIS